MARVLITGSSDGLGLMAARLLVDDGHAVILHARNERRGDDAGQALPGAEDVVIGDLESIAGMRQVAEQANALGQIDAVIHNAGIGYREPRRIETVDGLCHVFAVNVLAPYLLTALITAPDRLVYLVRACTEVGSPTSTTCSGPAAAGTAPRRTPTASSSTSCWPSRWPGTGRARCPMPWSRVGSPPRWAAPVHPTT